MTSCVVKPFGKAGRRQQRLGLGDVLGALRHRGIRGREDRRERAVVADVGVALEQRLEIAGRFSDSAIACRTRGSVNGFWSVRIDSSRCALDLSLMML